MKNTSSKRQGDPKYAIAYIRVSTTEQALGPEAQKSAIARWADAAGVVVSAWHFDEGVSGGTDLDNRRGLVAALADVKRHRAGILLIAKRDRIARDVYVASCIERAVAQCGARVVCADGCGNGDSAADSFMRTLLDAAAEYERALIRGRTRSAMAVKRARKESTGTAPWGYRVAEDRVHLEPDPAELAVQSQLVAMRVQQGLSFREIHKRSIERGLVNRKGRPFALQCIYAMIAGSGEIPSDRI